MLQQEEADDYVICSGHSRSVRELVDTAFSYVGIDADEFVRVDQRFVRPPEPVPLVGNPSKAWEHLGWKPAVSFEEMIGEMVEQDLHELGKVGEWQTT